MKLAILVVYLVAPGNEALLDLHLAYIEKNTTCDYTIYGSANRLTPALTSRLEEHPQVTLCSIPSTDLRLAAEHSYYLEHLLEAALADGATHFCILHVDSFPIQSGWNEVVFQHLDEKCVLCTTSKKGDPVKPTSFLCFTREFHQTYRPGLRLSEEESRSDRCRSFQDQYSAVTWDSGIGYLFRAYLEGLGWVGLERMTKRGGCAIYGDLLFHLEMAQMVGPVNAGQRSPLKKGLNAFLNRTKYLLMPLIPTRVLQNRNSRTRRILARYNRQLVLADKFALEREKLFRDPDQFIQHLRASAPQDQPLWHKATPSQP